MSFLYKWRNPPSCQHEIQKVQVEWSSHLGAGQRAPLALKESICVSNIFQELDTVKLPAPKESEKVLE